jgi:hypothetical protein
MSEPLATLDDVKMWLELESTTAHDEKLQMFIDIASERVRHEAKQIVGDDEVKAAREVVVDAWTTETVPQAGRAATATLVAHLFGFRGDQALGQALEDSDLPLQVRMHLSTLRDHAIA